MIAYMREHERYLAGALGSGKDDDLEHLREGHLIRIGFMQHERLIHLLVTITFAFFFLGSVLFAVVCERPGILPLSLLFLVLLVPYIIYYYRLENGVQRWYRLYDQIERKIREHSGAAS